MGDLSQSTDHFSDPSTTTVLLVKEEEFKTLFSESWIKQKCLFPAGWS